MKHSQPLGLALVFGIVCALLLGGRAAQARSLEPGPALDLAPSAALDPLGDPLTLTVTVGVGPGPCATTPAITVPAGTQVNYCYTLVNHTSYTLTRHTLGDTHLESIFAD